MKYDFLETTFFEKELKRLAKKYRSLKADIEKLQTDITNDTVDSFDDLGNGLKKIRLKITSKNKGKSAGGRVITQEIIFDTTNKTILMVAIWDKSEIPNIKTPILKKMVENFYKK